MNKWVHLLNMYLYPDNYLAKDRMYVWLHNVTLQALTCTIFN